MSGESLAALAGVALSLAFGYARGLSTWFEKREPEDKRLIMGVLVVVAGVGSLALSCANIIPGVECTQAGLLEVVGAIVAALIGNQSMYVLSSKSSTRR